MSEHTPGPWEVDDSGNVFAAHGRLVANCGGWQSWQHESRTENMANGVLVASTPELLAACEAAYRVLVHHLSCRDETKQLRAAIAKATQTPEVKR